MSRHMMLALVAGGISAVVFLSVVGGAQGGILFVYFGSLPLLLVGLSSGVAAGTVACASGFLLVGALGDAITALLYGVIHAVPALIVIRQGLQRRGSGSSVADWYPAGDILSVLSATGMGLLVLMAVFLWMEDVQVGSAIGARLDQIALAIRPDMSAEDREMFVSFLVPLFPGMVGASWMLMTVINGAIAQGLLIRTARNIRPKGYFGVSSIPLWMSWLLVISAAIALLGPGELGYMGRNLVMVAAVPFFFVGLSLVHLVVRRTVAPGMLLAVFYVMVIVSAWLAMVVAGLGIVDQWIGLRDRITGSGSGKE